MLTRYKVYKVYTLEIRNLNPSGIRKCTDDDSVCDDFDSVIRPSHAQKDKWPAKERGEAADGAGPERVVSE